jgi:hypothetical protein
MDLDEKKGDTPYPEIRHYKQPIVMGAYDPQGLYSGTKKAISIIVGLKVSRNNGPFKFVGETTHKFGDGGGKEFLGWRDRIVPMSGLTITSRWYIVSWTLD